MNMAGLILAGGRSSRMGSDKALLRLTGKLGPHMLAHTWEILFRCTAPCWVSCAPSRPYAGYPCLLDAKEGQGPIKSIADALIAAQTAACQALLILSCDLPFMDMATLHTLQAFHNQAPKETLVTMYASEQTGFVEPLVAIYETAALKYFEEALANGEHALFKLIPRSHQHLLFYSAENARPFFNMNTKEDWQKAHALSINQDAKNTEPR